MNKILINRSTVNTQTVRAQTQALDSEALKKSIIKKAKLDISELVSKDPILPNSGTGGRAHDEIIADLYAEFEADFGEMSNEELVDFSTRVRLEIDTIVENERLVKNKGLFIDTDQICMITGKQPFAGTSSPHKIRFPNIYKTVGSYNLDQNIFTLHWMPTLRPNSTLSIVRHKVLHTPGYMGWDLELLSNMRYRFNAWIWDRDDQKTEIMSVTSDANQLVQLNEWNHVTFGFDIGGIVIRVEDTVNTQAYSKSIDLFYGIRWDFLSVWDFDAPLGPTGYSEEGPILGDLYWVYPQLIFGGINVSDNTSDIGRLRNSYTTDERSIEPQHQVIELNSAQSRSIKNGLDSYYIIAFRSYIGVPSIEAAEDRFVDDLSENNSLSIASVLDVRFDKIQNGSIRDYSERSNLVVLTGDMKINIAADQLIIAGTKKPSLVSIEGPF
jgi:hypothetical protein